AAEARRVKSCRVMETPAARSLHGSRSQTKLNSPYSPNTPSGYSSEPQSRRGRGVVATNARKHETLFDQISCFRGRDVGLARRMKRLRPPRQSRWALALALRSGTGASIQRLRGYDRPRCGSPRQVPYGVRG